MALPHILAPATITIMAMAKDSADTPMCLFLRKA